MVNWSAYRVWRRDNKTVNCEFDGFYRAGIEAMMATVCHLVGVFICDRES